MCILLSFVQSMSSCIKSVYIYITDLVRAVQFNFVMNQRVIVIYRSNYN